MYLTKPGNWKGGERRFYSVTNFMKMEEVDFNEVGGNPREPQCPQRCSLLIEKRRRQLYKNNVRQLFKEMWQRIKIIHLGYVRRITNIRQRL